MAQPSTQTALVRGFVAARRGPIDGHGERAVAELSAALPTGLSDADACAFGAELARCVDDHDDATLAHGLADLHADDLWLAFRARQGHSDAVAELDLRCIQPLSKTIGRVDSSAAFVDEVRQRVRVKLLVAEAGKTAKLDRYRGRGELATWVRVVGAREALSASRRERRRAGVDDDDLIALEASTTGPELGAVKEQYRAAFGAAFREAIAQLSAQQRNVLRLHYLHGLTVDDLSGLLKVHRSSAARRVAKARSDLLSATRQRLQIGLRIGRSDFDDLMRLIASRIDVSIERHLGD